jgi:hypothetical protein
VAWAPIAVKDGFRISPPSIVAEQRQLWRRHHLPEPYSAEQLASLARRSKGNTGSLVVVWRGNTKNSYRRRVLRSIGFSRKRKVIVGPNEAWFTGQLRKVQHQVYVGYLDPSTREFVGKHKMRERFEHYDGGEMARFPEGQYLQVESNEQFTSLLWPSVQPLQTILSDLLATTGLDQERPVVVGFNVTKEQFDFDPETENPDDDPARPVRTNISGLIELLGTNENEVAYVDVDTPDFYFSWTRFSRKFATDGQPYPELAMRFTRLPGSLEDEIQYVEQTATPEVKARASEMLRNSSLLRPGSRGR